LQSLFVMRPLNGCDQRGSQMASKKKGRESFTYPEDTEQWLADLIEIGESVVIAYEKYLLNEIDHNELAKIMVLLRKNLPMKKQRPRSFKAKKKET